jgi:hypothetical protein
MWPVDGPVTRDIASRTYRHLGDGADPAAAVHATVREIKEQLPDRPTCWAAPVHVGP